MSPQELLQLCHSQPTITIVMGRRPVRGEKVRLCWTFGPYGRIVCVNSKHEVVARFDSQKVITFLNKHGY
jgi:hypothetical protein